MLLSKFLFIAVLYFRFILVLNLNLLVKVDIDTVHQADVILFSNRDNRAG